MASASDGRAARIRPQTPAARQRRKLEVAVAHGPQRVGRLRRGVPVARRQKVPSTTGPSFGRGRPRPGITALTDHEKVSRRGRCSLPIPHRSARPTSGAMGYVHRADASSGAGGLGTTMGGGSRLLSGRSPVVRSEARPDEPRRSELWLAAPALARGRRALPGAARRVPRLTTARLHAAACTIAFGVSSTSSQAWRRVQSPGVWSFPRVCDRSL